MRVLVTEAGEDRKVVLEMEPENAAFMALVLLGIAGQAPEGHEDSQRMLRETAAGLQKAVQLCSH